MEKKNLDEFKLLDFGNDYFIKGILFENSNKESLIVTLPQEKLEKEPDVIEPSMEDWNKLLHQLDYCETLGTREGQLVVLRKSQRQIDSKISWQVFRRDGFRCRYCNIDNTPLTVDHIITWEDGGATHVDNLLSACPKCNRTRGNLDYGSWLQHSYYLEKSKFLSPSTREANQKIVRNLNNLPTVKNKRSR